MTPVDRGNEPPQTTVLDATLNAPWIMPHRPPPPQVPHRPPAAHAAGLPDRPRGGMKMADSLGTRLTGRELLIRILARSACSSACSAPDEKMVGVLLPPTAGAAIVNAALALSGRVAVNLNYTASSRSSTCASSGPGCGT